MTTVLSVGNSEGARRCDARCHDAEPGGVCDCVCGGRYHAAGSSRVLDAVTVDVEAGVFGSGVAKLAGTAASMARQIARLQEQEPERIRFHAREVRKALYKRDAAHLFRDEGSTR